MSKEYEVLIEQLANELVDRNIADALKLKIEELEQQVKDYPDMVRAFKEVKKENVSLKEELSKVTMYSKDLLGTLDQKESQIKELKAAADDLESEATSSAEEIRSLTLEVEILKGRECERAKDAAEWQEKAQEYARENELMQSAYKSLQEITEQHRKEAEKAREYIKAVL